MINKHKHPEVVHRKSYHKNYFEGWYYKQVTKDQKNTISFIPGVSFEKDGNKSFIQCLHYNKDKGLKAYNIDYSIEAFHSIDQPFCVTIDKNIFSLEHIELDIYTKEVSIKGEIELINLTPIETSLLNPNIMGFFSYIPFMECNHGVLSMHHTLKGQLQIDGEIIDFTDGSGYIEKDWGRSFPSKYIWVQSNHFEDPTVGLFCSVATIPFVAFSFTGFICNLHYDGKEYRFATYKGTKLVRNEQSEKNVHLMLKNNDCSLEIEGEIDDVKKLFAPKSGAMNKVIKEGLAGNVKIILRDEKGEALVISKSNHCGMELVDRLQPM